MLAQMTSDQSQHERRCTKHSECSSKIKKGNNEVYVSSLYLRGDDFVKKRNQVNDELQNLCYSFNLSCCEHKNIMSKVHLDRSKLYVNNWSSMILQNNFQHIFNF